MAIACSEPVAEVASATDSASYSFSAFTPTANAILVVFAAPSDCTATGTLSGGGMFWHSNLLWTQDYGVSNQNRCALYWAQTDAIPSSTTITWSSPFDPATGMFMACWQFTGADLGNPIRQVKTARGTGTSPTLTFDSALLTANGYGFAFGSNVNPPTGTPPLTWTEIADTGYTPPTSGGCAAFRATGETGTLYSYNTAAAPTDEWGAIAFEISAAFDASLQPKPIIAQAKPAPRGRRVVLCASSLEPTTWQTFSAANQPKVTLVRPQPAPRAAKSWIAVGKMFEEVKPEIFIAKASPGKVAARAGRSIIAFLPDMQGPRPASVLMQQPRIAARRGKSIICGHFGAILPEPSRWLVVNARSLPAPRANKSHFMPTFPVMLAEQPARVVMNAPRITETYRRRTATIWTPEFHASRAIPPTVYGRPVRQRLPLARKAIPLVIEPLTEGDRWTPRSFMARGFAWQTRLGWPQTRIVWCPQTISTAVRKDDRDSHGGGGYSSSSTGGSGRNRSSTGVGTQG